MNYADSYRMVNLALAGGYGLWVGLDSGDFELFGADLESTWDMLSPGEAFTVLGVVLPQSVDARPDSGYAERSEAERRPPTTAYQVLEITDTPTK